MIANKLQVPLFQFVLDVLEKQTVNVSTYRDRAEILKEICPTSEVASEFKLSEIDCAKTVSWLAEHLFINCPSLVETSLCEFGCGPLNKPFPAKQMDIDILMSKNASKLMAEECQLDLTNCHMGVDKCLGKKKTTIEEIGRKDKACVQIFA